MKFVKVETNQKSIRLYILLLLQCLFVSLSIYRKKLRLATILILSSIISFILNYNEISCILYGLFGILLVREKGQLPYAVIVIEAIFHAIIYKYFGIEKTIYFAALIVAAYVTRWKKRVLTVTYLCCTAIVVSLHHLAKKTAIEIFLLIMLPICNCILFYYVAI